MGEIFARWVEAERGRFFLLLPVAMGAAILVYFALPTEPPLWTGAVGARHRPRPLWSPAGGISTARFARHSAAGRRTWLCPRRVAHRRRAADAHHAHRPGHHLRHDRRASNTCRMPHRITLIQPRIDAGPVLSRAIRLKLRAGRHLAAARRARGCRPMSLLFGPERPAWPGGWDMARDYFFSGLNATGFALTDLTLTAVGTAKPPSPTAAEPAQRVSPAPSSPLCRATPAASPSPAHRR